jgi:hypothetical protein
MNTQLEIAYPNIPINCAFARKMASGDDSIKIGELVLKPVVSAQLRFTNTPGSRGWNMTLQGFEWQGPQSRNGLITNVFMDLKAQALEDPSLMELNPGFITDYFQAMAGCVLCKTCQLRTRLDCDPLLLHQAPHTHMFVIPIVDSKSRVPRVEFTI